MKFRRDSHEFPKRNWSLAGIKQKFRERRHQREARHEARDLHHVALVGI